MRVLITGGTGFIGARLGLYHLALGHSVKILGQTNTGAEKDNLRLLESKGTEIILGSVTDERTVAQIVDGEDIVYHLAAAQHEANVPDEHFWHVNVRGTKNMLEASVSSGIRRFVHGSTIGVYGSAVQGEITEESPLRPDNIYGVTKSEGERLALSYSDKIPIAVVRISETYGPGDRRLLKLFKAIDKNIFFMIGAGENKHQLIYVDDLIRGLWLAATAKKACGEIFLLSGREVLTTSEMVLTIARTLNKRTTRFQAPLWPFLIVARILETTLRPFGIQPPLHTRRLDFFRKSFLFSSKKSSELLEFIPEVRFEEGVAETVRWYKEHGYL
jgi:nucleoside-diphosphate-sugar epimerase